MPCPAAALLSSANSGRHQTRQSSGSHALLFSKPLISTATRRLTGMAAPARHPWRVHRRHGLLSLASKVYCESASVLLARFVDKLYRSTRVFYAVEHFQGGNSIGPIEMID